MNVTLLQSVNERKLSTVHQSSILLKKKRAFGRIDSYRQVLLSMRHLLAFIMRLSGIILAGGKSRRMGQDKGLLDFRNKPLIAHVMEALKPLCDEVIIIANDQAYHEFGLPVYPDLYPDKGPLGGICTGLTYTAHEQSLVLSCDTPFINTPLLSHLVQQTAKGPIGICYEAGRVQPLVGLYGKSIQNELKEHLEADQLSLTKALSAMDHTQVEIHPDLPFYHPHLFFNINRPGDLNEAQTFRTSDKPK